ncbi:MAG: DUF3667 domain-containing protein [Bacteroidota bacterium]|nr:DUF3667 domain-containing protein [Bacteroidota bacterium]
MSHSKERAEKICLNCGAVLTGRYCHVCGQENIEPRESFWGLVAHFFNDITHFDGKFFSTGKYLLTRPGFLSAEYIKGRRASYLHPIRMYVFTSAFFFIIVFSLFNPEGLIHLGGREIHEKELAELKEAADGLKEQMPGTKDSVMMAAMGRALVNINRHVAALEVQVAKDKQDDSARKAITRQVVDTVANNINRDSGAIHLSASADKPNQPTLRVRGKKVDFEILAAYDSVQKELPEARRDDWFTRIVTQRTLFLRKKFKANKEEGINLLIEKFMHNLPKALFVSLPLFALILAMLYSRRQFLYTEHAIFSIHLYCANFIFLLPVFALNKLSDATGWTWLQIINTLIFIGSYLYLYKAMRRFYAQSRGKTIAKFILLNIVSFIVVMLLMLGFFFLSIWQFS